MVDVIRIKDSEKSRNKDIYVNEHNRVLVGLFKFICMKCGKSITQSSIPDPIVRCAMCGSRDIRKIVGDKPLKGIKRNQHNPVKLLEAMY